MGALRTRRSRIVQEVASDPAMRTLIPGQIEVFALGRGPGRQEIPAGSSVDLDLSGEKLTIATTAGAPKKGGRLGTSPAALSITYPLRVLKAIGKSQTACKLTRTVLYLPISKVHPRE